MALVTVTCSKCQRRYSYEDPDIKNSFNTDTFCVRCWILFPECNTAASPEFGINWRTATPKQVDDLRHDLIEVKRLIKEKDKWQGKPVVQWPEDGMDFVDELVAEVTGKREPRDGSRR